jgi:hypothetical protein
MQHLDRRRRRIMIAVALGGAVTTATAVLAPLGSAASPEPAPPAPVSPVVTAPAPGPAPVITPLSRGLSGASSGLVSWAPDGSRLGWVDGTTIVSTHPDGSGRVSVAAGFAVNALAWSAGGARVAFSASESAKPGDLPQLWIGTPTGGRPFKATAPTAAGRRTTGVTWLDGVTLVVSYTTAGNGPSRLGLVTLTKPKATTVPFVPSDPQASAATTQLLDPAAAPGGGLLAYRQRVPAAGGGSTDSLWVAGPRGGKARKLGEAAALGRPLWSADGRTVYAVRSGAARSDLVAYPVAGGSPVVLQAGVTGAPVLLRRPLSAGVARARRVTGRDAIATAVASSRAAWRSRPLPRGAKGAVAAVLVGAADPLDAAVAAPLAAAKGGPLLLTGRRLDARVAGELHRTLPTRATVYLVGPTRALPATLATALTRRHYRVVRLTGRDAPSTSVAVAVKGLGAPRTVIFAGSWQDALVAAPAAANLGGAVLLTRGTRAPAGVAAYVKRYRPTGYAVGGGAAAAVRSIAPGATRRAGRSSADTSVVVARALFLPASTAVLVTWAARQDAPVGAAAAAHLGQPLIVVDPRVLPASVAAYLDAASGSLDAVAAFGRPAVPAPVLVAAAVRLAAGRTAR